MKTYEIELADGRKVQFDWEGEGEPPNRIYQEVIDSVTKTGGVTQGYPQWVEPARTTAQAIGGGLASGLTAPLGPPSQVAAGGLAAAGSGQAFDRVAEMMGVKRVETPAQAGVKAGVETVLFGAAETIPFIVPPALNPIIQRIPGARKTVNQMTKRMLQIMEEEGIDLPAPVVTGSPGQAGLYQTLYNYPSSTKVIAEDVAEGWKGLEKMGKPLMKQWSISPTLAGEVAQTGEALRYQRLNTIAKRLEKEFLKEAKNVDIVLTKTRQEGQAILDSNEFAGLPNDLRDIIKRIIDKTQKQIPASQGAIITPSGQAAISTPASIQEVARTLDEVDELRKMVSDSASYEKVYAKKVDALFRRLRGAIDQDIKDQAPQRAYKALQRKNEFYSKEIYGKFKGVDIYKHKAMGETILRTDPSHVLNKANTVTGLNELEEIMSPEYFNVVRQAKIAELLETSIKDVDTIFGKIRVYDGDVLDRILYQRGDPAYIQTLFNPDELQALQKVIDVSQQMKQMLRWGGSQSGTPKGLFWEKFITGGAGALPGVVRGSTPEIIAGGIGGIALASLGPWATAKFITSEAGKRYLIEGIKLGAKSQIPLKAGSYMLPSWMRKREEAEMP